MTPENIIQKMSPAVLEEFLLEHKYNSAVKRLTNGLTHEYNNIFTGLSGQLNISLQRGEDEQLDGSRRRLIQQLVQRGIDQTEILYTFSRKTERRASLYSPRRILEKAAELLNSLSRMHRFEIRVEGDVGKIHVDSRDIVLSLFYLGENSIDAMSDGGVVQLSLAVTCEADGRKRAAFQMVDDGCGVSDDLLAGSDVTGTPGCIPGNIPGCGIGLWAARTLIQRHGGRVTFSRGKVRGTTVQFDFPLAGGLDAENTLHHNLRGKPKAKLARQVILIIDDEQIMRNVLLERLQRHGHIVFCAESCAEGVEEFSHLSEIISAVLLDIGMQDRSGYECAALLHQIRPQTKIILMSGQDFCPERAKAPDCLFLKKPFSIEQFEELLRDVEI